MPAKTNVEKEADKMFDEATKPRDDGKESLQSAIAKYLTDLMKDTEVQEQRAECLKRYYREPYGDERDGKSNFITSDCKDAVRWALPSLVNIFLSADKVVEFLPRTKEYAEQAAQATDMINYLFFEQNDAFKVLYTWFWDALVTKNGFVKYFYEEVTTKTDEIYTGLTEMELARLTEYDEIKIKSVKERIIEIPSVNPVPIQVPQPPAPGENGQLVQQPPQEIPANIERQTVYDVETRREKTEGHYVVENVSPEDVFIDEYATSIDDARFIAIKTKKTRSDLIAMGVKPAVIDELEKGSGEFPLTSDAVERDAINDVESAFDGQSEDYYLIFEAYIKYTKNENEEEKLHQVIFCGISNPQILFDTVVPEAPIAMITPFIKPYSVTGESLVEDVMDIQRVNTSLYRNMLDYIYQSISPPWEVEDRAIVNKGDLLNRVPMGIIRTQRIGAIQPITVPPVPVETFNILDRVRQTRDERTGVTPLGRGLDSNALNTQTATGVVEAAQLGQQLQDCIARSFAELGVKRLYKGLYGLVIEHQNAPLVIRLRRQFIEVDPSTWTEPVDLIVNVGLGTGSAKTKVNDLQQLLALQVQMSGQGVANAKNIYNTCARIVNTLGYKDIESFFTDPDTLPPPQPQPTAFDIELQKIQADLEKEKMQGEVEVYKADLQAQTKLTELQTDTALKREALRLKTKEGDKVPQRVDYFPGVDDR